MKNLSVLALALGLVSGVATAADLTVYTAGPKGLANQLIKDFEEVSGNKVQVYQATTGRILGRLKAEEARPVADVVILASWPAAMGLQSEGLLHTFTPENADKLHDGWNGDNQLFAYSGSALGITYNTRLVKDAPASLTTYTEDNWAGQVVIPDPTESGSALDFISGVIANDADKAWTLFNAWQQNDIDVNGANRPALNQVVNGSKSVVLAGVDYMGYGEKAKGNPIEVIYPAEGTVIAPRPVMVLESSDKKPQAEVFVNYLLTERAQNIVAKNLLLPGRSDVKADPSRPDFADIKQLDYDWNWMFENQANVTKKFSAMFR
ncbi:extracellular solute-binding protein [Vibrio sp. SCSIO 43140]|uniref:extracellular solute-binding protein n=1 Tax=Vibrio sp. SCSIO 43140 TaxID=2819100 RepID=UPI002074C1BF|nr:extracellular solute-binding protein [Vibrio sp. SCSIO 43140]USD61236.1 extracellular solute-binding protein [Vibrio sp. SCSIO 43140]